MLTTINLDYESLFKTCEIDDVWAQWLLPSEFHALQLFAP